MSAGYEQGERTLYVDCAAGIAGDMFLASLADLTEGGEYLRGELAKLPLANYELEIYKDVRGGMSGLRFGVKAGETHIHRHLSDIENIISASALPVKVKAETARAFTLLASAEAKVHGIAAERVHFHEVGAVDSIIDLTGAMIMLDYLGWPRVVFSPLNTGSGTVKCAHGVMPVPAPAAAELLRGVSVYSQGEPMERVTPTGAALVKTLGAEIADAMPAGRIEKIGVGLGTREGSPPNLLRTTLIKTGETSLQRRETFRELCANLDDMNPQDLSAVMSRLFEEGALDVWFEPIQMKKNRPAVKLCCLAAEAERDKLAEIILRETTTLGVRVYGGERYILDRRVDSFNTPLGEVRIKSAISRGKVLKRMPEFDDILKLSKKHKMSVLAVREILSAAGFVSGSEESPRGGDAHSCGRAEKEGAV